MLVARDGGGLRRNGERAYLRSGWVGKGVAEGMRSSSLAPDGGVMVGVGRDSCARVWTAQQRPASSQDDVDSLMVVVL